MTKQTTEPRPGGSALSDELGPDAPAPVRWYCVSREGLATLCKDEADAHDTATSADADWPTCKPHRAVQLVDVAEVERLRATLAAIAKHSTSTLRTNSKDRGDWAEDVAFMGKLASGH